MRILSRLRSLFRTKKMESDMAEEMRLHLELQAGINLKAGLSPDEARFAAQRQFGNVASIQEHAREQRGWRWLEHTIRNFRFAVRQLAKFPGFTAITILTLALGIGASTAIYSVVHALLLTPLRYHDAGQIVRLQSRQKEGEVSDVAPATFGDLNAGNAAFAALAAQYYYYVNLTGTDTPSLLNSADVTADFFRLFAVAPLRGRTWTTEDLKPGAVPVVVLGHALWRSQFNSSDSIIGQQIMLDETAFTVIGVMPESFKDPAGVAQLWRPMRPGIDDLTNRSSRYWTIFGRLKTGVTLGRANVELATFGQQLVQAHPKNYEGWSIEAVDLRSQVVGDYHTGLLVVLGAVGCVMLITSANVTGLSLVRAAARRKELAIRMALGSSRRQLVGLILTENLLLAVIGGVGGVLLGGWGLGALLASLPEGWLPRAEEISLNLPVLGTSLALALLSGLASGLTPGFTASRVEANDALKDGTRGSAGPSAARLRATLIVVEIALALVLLAGTGLLGRSFLGLLQKKPGLDAARLLSLTVSLSAKRYDSADKCWGFFSRAETEVAAVPGVEAAGFSQTSPFRWGIPVGFVPERGEGAANTANLPEAYSDSVSVDYFKAIGCPLRAGRLFTPADDTRSTAVVILSETAARIYFGTENPLGRFITPGAPARFEVVGVVGDVRRAGLATDIPLQVYRPLAQRTPPFATLMVRTSLPPATLAKSVQAALWRVDANTPVSDVATMDTYVSRSVTQPRFYLVLFSLFAFLALLLAGIGLYGLVAYSVAQRTREFGIRTALGARPQDVLVPVLREGGKLVGFGLVLGLAGSFAAARLLQNMVYDTSVYDPAVFLVVPLVLTVVTAVACYLPARRATKIDPLTALRAE
jgi:putative ABC transport system permease protein